MIYLAIDNAGSVYRDTTALSFSVSGDLDPPQLPSLSPVDNAIGFATDASFALQFDEAVQRGTGALTLRSGSPTGPVVETFDAATSTRISINGAAVTVTPSTALSPSTRYYLTAAAGTFTDLSGNAFAGLSDLTFFTRPAGPTIYGTPGPDQLTGTALGESIFGLAGDDVITGADGIDFMDGQDGSDIYPVASAAHFTQPEIADSGISGTDELRFALTTTGTLVLQADNTGLERAVIGTGTALAPVLSGRNAASLDASLLRDGITLIGNSGNNSLTGGLSGDVLTGGAGVDTFVITAGTDSVTDLGAGGADALIVESGATVNATVTGTWTASATTRNRGTANLATSGIAINLAAVTDTTNGAKGFSVTATGLRNSVTGSSLNDTLLGGTGADTLNGGPGIDTLTGGAGNDAYTVDDVGDVVTEALNAGADTVTASITYTLGDHLESLVLSGVAAIDGTGNDLANRLTGNSANNTLRGLAGSDTLDGKGGNDALIGGSGNDSYVVDAAGDTITELLNDGLDGVSSSISWTLGDHLENLTLTGLTAIDGSGNDLGNRIAGNSGNNLLVGLGGRDTLGGGAGADRLIGGASADSLNGGAGPDVFRFESLDNGANRDTITDFTPGEDVLEFSASLFTGLTGGAGGSISADQFNLGTAATTAAHRVIYNSVNGALYYDADGTGPTPALLIATLSTLPVISNAQMRVVQ